MVQPLWLPVVLGGEDAGVEEHQDDDEPEHGLHGDGQGSASPHVHCYKSFGGFSCFGLMTLCEVKFRQIQGNGRKFRHKELSNSVIS